MVKKSETEMDEQSVQLSEKIKGSARQIWLAGLGAYNKAEEDAGKIFEKLVKEGEELEHLTRDTVGKGVKAVEDRVEEVKDRVEGVKDRVGGVREKANDTFGKLEGIFDQRVSAALVRLGMPSNKRIEDLEKRIEELEAKLKG